MTHTVSRADVRLCIYGRELCIGFVKKINLHPNLRQCDMRFFCAICLLTFAILSACTDKGYTPRNGDLLFKVAGTSEISMAIADATAWRDSVKFSHVAIVATERGRPYVLEATGGKGVVRTEWEDFMSSARRADGTAGVVVMRVTDDFPADKAIARAKEHLGEEYDWSYYPDNGKMYCSELVYECFRRYDGTPLFTARPMNFRNSNGDMPRFWVELFEKLNEPVPEGVEGTNPNDMSKEPVLTEVYRFF